MMRTRAAWWVLSVSGLASALGCGGGAAKDGGEAEATKKAFEQGVADAEQPVALIAAYLPYLLPPEPKDRFVPKRRPSMDRASTCAANEIRHAATSARQKLERSSSDATKALQAAFQGVAIGCADASEPEQLAKCADAVKALDVALEKTGAAAAAAGVTAKLARVAPAAVTDKAKAAIAPFLKARGPGPAEEAYAAKRADPGAAFADVVAACQAASGEADGIASAFEKAEEPIRLIAVTRKMSMEAQCNGLNAVDAVRKDVEACKKKKTPECVTVCGKAKTAIGDGLPAAALLPFEKEYADVCKP